MWNFSGLCSERKQKEVADLLILTQWLGRSNGKGNVIDGYKWFGKPHK